MVKIKMMEKTPLQYYKASTEAVAATEFALIAPVLILILIAMVDYGIYINNALKIENVARASAEYIINGGDENLVMQDVILPSNLGVSASNADDLTFETELLCECIGGEAVSCNGSCASGDYVRRFRQVTLDMDFSPLFPYPGLPSEITLRGHTRIQANE